MSSGLVPERGVLFPSWCRGIEFESSFMSVESPRELELPLKSSFVYFNPAW